jgi:hypothetical protein
MPLSSRYWSRVFRQEFSPQLRAIVDALEKRTLPGFDGIEAEAETVSNEAWESFMSGAATGEEDPSAFAEAAQEIGVNHYLLLDGVRQGIINLFTASLHHAFEQQLMLFHRRECLHPSEENNAKLFNVAELRARLKPHGIEVSAFKSWRIIEELRLVANTVKHADGDSARKLHALRPDFFRRAGLPGMGEWVTRWQPRVFQPLVGRDLFVELKDVREYRDTLIVLLCHKLNHYARNRGSARVGARLSEPTDSEV